MKIIKRKSEKYPKGELYWKCPGCGGGHFIPADDAPQVCNGAGNGAVWHFNGDYDNPTITPSVNVFTNSHNKGIDTGNVLFRCHSVIANGVITYCDDCTHEMKGKSVPMVDLDPDYYNDKF